MKNARLEGIHLRLPGYGQTGPTLEIYSYSEMEEKPLSTANRLGFGHIAFLVDDVEDCVTNILASGGKKLGNISETIVDGVGKLTFTYCLDPEENILEIQHWELQEMTYSNSPT